MPKGITSWELWLACTLLELTWSSQAADVNKSAKDSPELQTIYSDEAFKDAESAADVVVQKKVSVLSHQSIEASFASTPAPTEQHPSITPSPAPSASHKPTSAPIVSHKDKTKRPAEHHPTSSQTPTPTASHKDKDSEHHHRHEGTHDDSSAPVKKDTEKVTSTRHQRRSEHEGTHSESEWKHEHRSELEGAHSKSEGKHQRRSEIEFTHSKSEGKHQRRSELDEIDQEENTSVKTERESNRRSEHEGQEGTHDDDSTPVKKEDATNSTPDRSRSSAESEKDSEYADFHLFMNPRSDSNVSHAIVNGTKEVGAAKAIETKGEHQSLMRPVHMKPPSMNATTPSLISNASHRASHTRNASNHSNTNDSSATNESNVSTFNSRPGHAPGEKHMASEHEGSGHTNHHAGGREHHSQQIRPVGMTHSTNLSSTSKASTSGTPAPTDSSVTEQTTISTSETPAPTDSSTTKGPPLPPDSHDANIMSLPDDFKHLHRDGEWTRSPFVSQAHLDRLWNYLFSTYYKEVPPVPEYGGPLPVGVGINVVKFKEFDEVAGTMNVALNLRLCWADARLGFDAKEFFNITWNHEGDKIPIRSDLVWTPDVTVLNEVGRLDRLLASHRSPLVLSDDSFMKETGVNVLWSHPLDVKSNCEVDMTQYPFDVQRCYIVVGSWASSRRQMVLIPQPFFQEETVHTSEFYVQNITNVERMVYTKGTAQSFNEVVYTFVLRRYPHYYVVNYILPMVAMTLLTVATMWMSPGNVGPRVNSGTKLLLCVVSIIFITARSRPAVSGDIWIDQFQTHCLALSMSAVLESLFIDWLTKTTTTNGWLPRHDTTDSILRAIICGTTTVVIFSDARQVQYFKKEISEEELQSWHFGWQNLRLFTDSNEESSRLLVFLVYLIFFGLVLSSVFSVLWVLLPRWLWRRMLGKEEGPSEEPIPTVPDGSGSASSRRRTPATGQSGTVQYEACPTREDV